MFTRLDNFMMDRFFQPIADWFQKWTGLDNFFLARMVGILHLMVLWFFVQPKGSPLEWSYQIPLGSSIFWVIAGPFWAKFQYEKTPKDFLNPVRYTLGVPRKIGMPIVCLLTAILFLALVILSNKLKIIVVLPGIWTIISFIYFLCCTPKPPSTSKLGKMWNRLAQSISFGLPEQDPAKIPI